MARARSGLSISPGAVQAGKALLAKSRSRSWALRGQHPVTSGGLRILYYHRVTNDDDPLAVTPRRFAEQMDYLASNGYRTLHVAEAVGLATSRDAGDVIGLAFDDGYRDVAEHALPVMERYSATASMFVVPEVVDGTARFTWYRSPPPVLSWADIVQLDRSSPLHFEAHTLSHPNLTSLDDAAAWHEIAGSREVLAERLERPVSTFCYPGGFYGEREVAMTAAAGYSLAVTCDPGLNVSRTHPLTYRRTAIDGWDTLTDFRAKLAGAHDRPLPLQALYRRLR